MLSDRNQNPPQIIHAMIPFIQNYKKCKHYAVTADRGCLGADVGKGRTKRIQRGLRNLLWTSIYSPCVGMFHRHMYVESHQIVNFKYMVYYMSILPQSICFFKQGIPGPQTHLGVT